MGLITAGSVVVTFLVCAQAVALHYVPTPEHRWNGVVFALLFFNFLNIFIALCEVGLGLHVKDIQSRYRQVKTTLAKEKRPVWNQVIEFFTLPMTLAQILDGKTFVVHMWSTYALYDPAYQNNESFGFFIDVGNGYTTIAPCILVNLALTVPSYLSAKLGEETAHLWVACVGIASYWQIAYGTIIYFSQFLYHERYQGHGAIEVLLFVIVMNAIWIIFPFWGIYVCWEILKEGSLDCLTTVDVGFLSKFQLSLQQKLTNFSAN
jgi:hypothetical protein